MIYQIRLSAPDGRQPLEATVSIDEFGANRIVAAVRCSRPIDEDEKPAVEELLKRLLEQQGHMNAELKATTKDPAEMRRFVGGGQG